MVCSLHRDGEDLAELFNLGAGAHDSWTADPEHSNASMVTALFIFWSLFPNFYLVTR